MKTKKLGHKLTLNKLTIGHLDQKEVNQVRGGAQFSIPRFCGTTADYYCTQPCSFLLGTYEFACEESICPAACGE